MMRDIRIYVSSFFLFNIVLFCNTRIIITIYDLRLWIGKNVVTHLKDKAIGNTFTQRS